MATVETKSSKIEGMQKEACNLIQQAYSRGYKDGYFVAEDSPILAQKLSVEYQKGHGEGNVSGYEDGLKDGMEKAWNAARRIRAMEIVEWDKVFGDCKDPIDDYSAKEAIELLNDYDEEQNVDKDLCAFCFSMPNCSACPIKKFFPECGNGLDICVRGSKANEIALQIVEVYNLCNEVRNKESGQ